MSEIILSCFYLLIFYWSDYSVLLHFIVCLIGYKWCINEVLFTDFLFYCIHISFCIPEFYQFFLLGSNILHMWPYFLSSVILLSLFCKYQFPECNNISGATGASLLLSIILFYNFCYCCRLFNFGIAWVVIIFFRAHFFRICKRKGDFNTFVLFLIQISITPALFSSVVQLVLEYKTKDQPLLYNNNINMVTVLRHNRPNIWFHSESFFMDIARILVFPFMFHGTSLISICPLYFICNIFSWNRVLWEAYARTFPSFRLAFLHAQLTLHDVYLKESLFMLPSDLRSMVLNYVSLKDLDG